MNRLFHRSVAGFGLMELLSAVAIIAVLAALLMPAFSGFRNKADEARCANNLRQLFTAVGVYAQDNDGKIPSGNANGGDAWSGTPLRQYVFDNFDRNTNSSIDRRDSPFTCPAAKRARKASGFPATYGWNNYNVDDNGKQIRLARIPQPSRTALITDGVYSSGRTWFQEVGMSASSARKLDKEADFVHGGKVNVLFLDGHIELRAKASIPDDPQNIFWLYSGQDNAN